LYEPEIPANTGNIIRLCANAGNQLHLIKPLGFELSDKKLRRAGLDYHEWVNVKVYEAFDEFVSLSKPERLYALTTKGNTAYHNTHFQQGDTLLFGPETRGLPSALLAQLSPEMRLYLPMQASSRSLNLSNTVAIVLYEAWRQLGFTGAAAK
jgi:Predicted rRNA methylase (SpoU class)